MRIRSRWNWRSAAWLLQAAFWIAAFWGAVACGARADEPKTPSATSAQSPAPAVPERKFTAAEQSQLDEAKKLVKGNRRRYEPFGLAVERRYAFHSGARPVLYMPADEAERIIAADELWRVVVLDLEHEPPIDWSFEREWRLANDLPLRPNGAVALVENWKDADELYDRFNGHPPCAGVIPLNELFGSP